MRDKVLCLLGSTIIWATAAAFAQEAEQSSPELSKTPTEVVLTSISQPDLQQLAADVQARSPAISGAASRNRAAWQQVAVGRSVADPVLGLTAFLAPPETRVGPQRATASLSQALPWSGKRALRSDVAAHGAEAGDLRLEAERLRLLTETRRLYYELAYATEYREINRIFRRHLVQHEQIAQARYSTGVGSAQGVVKLQAEITRVDSEHLEVESHLVSLLAQLNALRDRPAETPIELPQLPPVEEVGLFTEELVAAATVNRPELGAAEAQMERAVALGLLASKQSKPDFRVGFTYTYVEKRQDQAGQLNPPEGNGDDVFGLMGSFTLPVWKSSREARLTEALEFENEAVDIRRQALSRMSAAIGDLTRSLPLTWRRLRLIEDVLIVQARESLESAKAGYVAGTLDALDLLDAEHVLFDAETAAARATADYVIGIAQLEGAAGTPLSELPESTRDPS